MYAYHTKTTFSSFLPSSLPLSPFAGAYVGSYIYTKRRLTRTLPFPSFAERQKRKQKRENPSSIIPYHKNQFFFWTRQNYFRFFLSIFESFFKTEDNKQTHTHTHVSARKEGRDFTSAPPHKTQIPRYF